MFDKIFVLFLMLGISGCSSIVEPIKISGLSPNPNLQEKFSVELIPLTFSVANELNLQEFPRFVSLPSNTVPARKISAQSLSQNQFPSEDIANDYRLGGGDVVTLIQTLEAKQKMLSGVMINPPSLGQSNGEQAVTSVEDSSTNIISTKGRVGPDGSLLLIGVGRLDAQGRTIVDLRDEVRSILIRNGKLPDFQLEVTEFNSQKALVTTDAAPDEQPDQLKYILQITDRPTPLREIIATAGVAFDENVLTVVKLQRDTKIYSFTLASLFDARAPAIFLKNNDHIIIQTLNYTDSKVFLVGGVEPKILKIRPETRPTLAEILFAENGPLGDRTAQRSAVYLLRGHNPVKAYHLDTQNPARIFVADTLEMRPDDIVYVAEQPINTFNRVLETILPLRIFSRDARDNNLP